MTWRRLSGGEDWHLCCLCFEWLQDDDLWVCPHGQTWDVCPPCGEREGCLCDDPT